MALDLTFFKSEYGAWGQGKNGVHARQDPQVSGLFVRGMEPDVSVSKNITYGGRAGKEFMHEKICKRVVPLSWVDGWRMLQSMGRQKWHV